MDLSMGPSCGPKAGAESRVLGLLGKLHTWGGAFVMGLWATPSLG